MNESAPTIVDIGLNLTHKSFWADLPGVVARGREAGVRQMVLTGTTVESSREALELARSYSGAMFSTAGIHPHHASNFEPGSLTALKDLAAEPQVAAIGECGLDFYRNFSPRSAQQECLREQLGLAVELGLPVFLHERDAHVSFVAILREAVANLKAAVVHCFTGSRRALEAYLYLGCFIGITGWVCDERRGGKLRELVPSIPLDRLMIETDAPYLLPRDLKPKPKTTRNEPCHLAHIGRAVADIRGIPYEDLAAATTENARRFFGLPAVD
ncbi:MAG: 3'-5' ssDNA/RNA exonuclease TatD [Verrucomicrobia subdivision 3 bacterium]|nr:3'-5' ssDNA/RNA exonuclease TatD [Limisphaerales bacterium]MCS1415789.1 3'-5' ssDNA/RNA exonuclease TatD [Limisphaerales bacterium]